MNFAKLSTILCALALCANAAAQTYRTYTNPLFTEGRPADPDVIFHEGRFFLYATTHGRGYDVYVSTNLVDWKNEGLAFKAARGGAWAPDLFHHANGDGKFYLYYTDDDPARGRNPTHKRIGVAVADNPRGPFQDKAVLATDAIDAHLFQDDDGKFYFYYVIIAGGFKIMAQEMADPLTKQGEPREVIRPTQEWEQRSGAVTEGPFMLKHKGLYYLTYSGSGADSQFYGIGYATSKSPMGPFEKYPGNPIAKSTGNVFGPGHHCVIEGGPDKKLWMLYHQKNDEKKDWNRFVAIDPIWFDEKGELKARVSRGTPQLAPWSL